MLLQTAILMLYIRLLVMCREKLIIDWRTVAENKQISLISFK